MTPEEKARIKIDQMFEDAGWQVVDRDFYSPTITAAAIREGLLKGNKEADYFLFLNGKAVGVLEAKREEIDPSSSAVSLQTSWYTKNVPNCYQKWSDKLPFGYQSNGVGQAEISYVVMYSDAAGFIGPCADVPTITVPNVIKNLISDPKFCCTVGSNMLTCEPQQLFPGDYPKFKEVLCDPQRELPIIYISPQRDEEGLAHLWISPDEAAKSVAANAIVYYSEDLDFSKEMRYCGKDAYGCSDGAVRVYGPHIDLDDDGDSYRHRFFLAKYVEEKGEAHILNILRRAFAQDVHLYDSLFRLDSCKELVAEAQNRARIEALKEKSECDVDEAMKAFLDESDKRQEAERLAREYCDQLEDEKRDNHSLNVQLDAFRDKANRCAIAEAATQSIKAIEEFPDTPAKIARYFEVLYPERIVFTERGRRSLEECPTKCEMLWEVLYHVATDLYELLKENPANAYKEFTDRTGWECSRGEGKMTRKDSELMKQYQDTYNNRKINIEPHIKNQNKESHPHFVRLHFAFVEDKIVIGHCGKHLDNYSTRKIK
mgnify:CR=1 FL=1